MSNTFNRFQTVFLQFTNTAPITTAYVSCPFACKEIAIRNIICNSTNSNVATYPQNAYGLVYSDVCPNMYLGSVFLNSNYQSQLSHNVRYCFSSPIKIGGTYTFTLADINQPAYPVANNSIVAYSGTSQGGTFTGTFNVAIVFEFIQANSEITNSL
jgi:hypothetical protein